MPNDIKEEHQSTSGELISRKNLVEELARKLIDNRFVALYGPEGTGKTSIVDKLLPTKLTQTGGETDFGNQAWRITSTKPGSNPINNLIEDIRKISPKTEEPAFPLFCPGTLLANDEYLSPERFRSDPDILTSLYNKAFSYIRKPFHWLIVIDESQELFRYQQFWKKDTRNKATTDPITGDDIVYLNLLLNAWRSNTPVYIILTFNSLYFRFFSNYRGLPEAINNSRVYVSPMSSGAELKGYIKNKLLNIKKEKINVKNGKLNKSDEGAENDPKNLTSDEENIIDSLECEIKIINEEYHGSAFLKLEMFLDLYQSPNFTKIKETYDQIGKYKNGTQTISLDKKKECGLDPTKEFCPALHNVFVYYIENKLNNKIKNNIVFKFKDKVKAELTKQKKGETEKEIKDEIEKLVENGFVKDPEISAENESDHELEKEAEEKIKAIVEKELKIKFKNSPLPSRGMFILQALTTLNNDNHPERAPIKMEDLAILANRETAQDIQNISGLKLPNKNENWDVKKIYEFLNTFNDSIVHCINLPESKDNCSPDTIIDINHTTFLTSWPRLKELIFEEAENVMIYRNLVRDAIKYYSTDWNRNQDGEPSTPEPSAYAKKVYTGASYENVNNWIKRCKPDEFWCKRYLDNKLSEETKNALIAGNTLSQDEIKHATNFSLAVKFFKESVSYFEEQKEKRDLELKRAKMLTRRALILALLCVVFGAFTLWSRLTIIKEKKRIETRDFISTLSFNNVLNTSNDIYAERDELQGIRREIDKNKKLLGDENILRYLLKTKYLNIDSTDAKEVDLSFKALTTLKNLDSSHYEKEKKNLLNYYQKMQGLPGSSAGFKQFPAFYNSFYAYYWWNAPYDKKFYTHIGPYALRSLNKAKAAYAFGSKEGKILFFQGDDTIGVESKIGFPFSTITCLDFGADGTLYFGDNMGNIWATPTSKIMQAGLEPNIKTVHFGFNSPVIYLRTFPNFPNRLLVVTSNDYLILHKNGQGTWEVQNQLKNNNLESAQKINGLEWYPDEALLLVGSGKWLTVFALDPGSKAENLTCKALISSQDIFQNPCLTAYGIHKKKLQTDPQNTLYNVSMGDDYGGIWIGELRIPNAKNSHKTIAVRPLDSLKYFKDAHPGTISRLVFNPEFPQLASGSTDGTLKFWNLNNYKSNNVDVDNVYVRYGTRIDAMEYLDKNRLVVHSGGTHFIEPTNLHFMAEYLEKKR